MEMLLPHHKGDQAITLVDQMILRTDFDSMLLMSYHLPSLSVAATKRIQVATLEILAVWMLIEELRLLLRLNEDHVTWWMIPYYIKCNHIEYSYSYKHTCDLLT